MPDIAPLRDLLRLGDLSRERDVSRDGDIVVGRWLHHAAFHCDCTRGLSKDSSRFTGLNIPKSDTMFHSGERIRRTGFDFESGMKYFYHRYIHWFKTPMKRTLR